MRKIFISIATYNEKENIEKLISSIFSLNIPNLNILIIDDNSPDGTAQIVEKLIDKHSNHLHLIKRESKLGYGTAHIAGFKYSLNQNADLILTMDADFSHDPKDIPRIIEQIDNGFDVSIGSRRVKGGKVVGWNWWRKIMSANATYFTRILLNIKTKDVTTGYRCYRKDVLNKINIDKIKSNGYAFLEETIHLCEKNRFKIKEIPTTFVNRQFGQSKLGRKEIVEFIKVVIKLKFKKHD